MKPRSIISLIIAGVLVLCGIITCVVASFKAKGEGIMLFPEADSDGNLVYCMDLDSTTKITVDSGDADIEVVTGAEKSVIEVVNFNANYYKLTSSNGSLNFAQVDDFMSMFKFWDNGFSFKGMRYILRFGDDAAGDKKVIIRLSDDDNIRLVNLSSDTGTISLTGCAYDAEYTLQSDAGKIQLTDITGAASISISGNTAEITAENCQTRKLTASGNAIKTVMSGITADESTVNITSGSLEAIDCSFAKMSATTVSGALKISPYDCAEGTVTSDSGKVSLDFSSTGSLVVGITTVSGRINVNGEYVESFSLNTADASGRVSVSTTTGDIIINHPKE